jgi:hypothetical protein
MYKENESRINSVNAYFHSVQNHYHAISDLKI